MRRSISVATTARNIDISDLRVQSSSSVHQYTIYERQYAGKPLVEVTLQDLLSEISRPAIRTVIFGEEHGNTVAHHLESVVYSYLVQHLKGGCALSLEMLTTEQQDQINRFSLGKCGASAAELLEAAGWEANNYAPLLEVARESGNRIVGANAPRRLTSLVAKEGMDAFDRISLADLQLLAPMPLKIPSQQMAAKLGPIFGKDMDRRQRMLLAQSLWDATMAWSILREIYEADIGTGSTKGRNCFHVCGRYHCEHFLGIPEHMEHYLLEGGQRPSGRGDLEEAQLRVIVCISQSSLEDAQEPFQAEKSAYLADAADFIVLCP